MFRKSNWMKLEGGEKKMKEKEKRKRKKKYFVTIYLRKMLHIYSIES